MIVTMDNTAPLEQLAAQLYATAKDVSRFCEQQNHLQRSFDHIEPATLLPARSPQNVLAAQQSINETATRIQQLVTDPNDFLGRFQVQVSPTFSGSVSTQSQSHTPMLQSKRANLELLINCGTHSINS